MTSINIKSAALICLTICLAVISGSGFAIPQAIVAANAENVNPAPVITLKPSQEALSVWAALQPLSSNDLTGMLGKTSDPIDAAWIKLALISKESAANIQKLVAALIDWREENPSHPGTLLFPEADALSELPAPSRPKHLAILLPEHGPFKKEAEAIREGIMNAYRTNNTKDNPQEITFYDTGGKRSISDVYKQAVTAGTDFIIGPLTKADVQALSFTGPFTLPILALNYTDSSNNDSHFYEFGLLPEDDAAQIARRAHSQQLSRALIIAPDNAFGKRLVAAFTNEWQPLGGTILDNLLYTRQTDFNAGIARLLNIDLETDKKLSKMKNNRDALMQQRRQDIDVIVLFAQPKEANIIVPLLKYYYAGNIPVYATASIYGNQIINNEDLNRVIVCNVSASKLKNTAVKNKLFALGRDAYQLSQSIQRLAALPYFPLYSETGALTIDDKLKIHRRLPCFALKDVKEGPNRHAAQS